MDRKIRIFFQSRLSWVMTAVFFLMLLLNILTVKTSDDLGYSISHGIIDIFKQEYVQYMTWTGRSVAHIIARIFLSLPKVVFNLCNALLFTVFCRLVAMHAAGDREKVTPVLYLLSALAVFLFVPVFGQTVLWETGSCNYLWTTSIILVFLWFYRDALNEPKKRSLPFVIAFFLLGVLAGWTNENTGGACILMALVLLGFHRWKKGSVESWMVSGIFGAVFGFLILITAPGNAIRAQDFINEGGKAYVLVHDLFNFIHVLGKVPGQLLVWLGLGGFTALAVFQKTRGSDLFLPACYALSGIAAVFAIILSPVPVEFDRSMFGATVLVIIGALGMLSLLKQESMKIISVSLAGVLMVLSLRNYACAVVDLAYTRYQFQNREAWVAQQKASWNLSPVIPEINSEFFTEYNAMYGLNDILESESFVNNRNYAATHGLNFVTSTTLDKWNDLYRNGDSTLMNLFELEAYLDTLLTRGDCISIVTSSHLTENDAPLLGMVNSKLGTSFSGEGYLIGTFAAGGIAVTFSPDPISEEYNLAGQYVFASAQEDPSYCDIVINGLECTNDNPGISIVTMEIGSGRILDSVTWSSLERRGSRHYTEK